MTRCHISKVKVTAYVDSNFETLSLRLHNLYMLLPTFKIPGTLIHMPLSDCSPLSYNPKVLLKKLYPLGVFCPALRSSCCFFHYLHTIDFANFLSLSSLISFKWVTLFQLRQFSVQKLMQLIPIFSCKTVVSHLFSKSMIYCINFIKTFECN